MHFFRSLGTALDMKLHFTSGYHPEGDRQTEHTNQTLEQYIRVYCNYQQDNWYRLLQLSEFAYNNAPSATTKVTPFYANKGYHLNLTVHLERNLTSPQAKAFVTDLDELHQHLRENMVATQLQYQGTADAHRLPAPIGSRAFMKAQFFRTTHPSKKLADKFLGPYEVIVQPGTHSVMLWLPDNLCAVHPVFHVGVVREHGGSPGQTCNHKEKQLCCIANYEDILLQLATTVDSNLTQMQDSSPDDREPSTIPLK